MKIQGRKSQSPMQSIGPVQVPVTQEAAAGAPEPVQLGDQVELRSASELRRLNAAAAALPTVRAEKVEGLKDQIDGGNYYVESDKLARKVVEETLRDALAAQGSTKKA